MAYTVTLDQSNKEAALARVHCDAEYAQALRVSCLIQGQATRKHRLQPGAFVQHLDYQLYERARQLEQ